MRFDKERAFELRRQGKSYKEIRSLLGMSLAILSDWFRNEDWSKEIKSKLASAASAKNPYKLELMYKARKKKLDILYDLARKEAGEQYQRYSNQPLFIAGLMIYWGEGDKISKYRSGIANTEPLMIRIFIRFLQEICKVDSSKIKMWVLLYPDLEDSICQKYWLKASGLNEYNLSRSITIQGKSTVRRLRYGVCNVAFHNRYFKEKMLTWLALAAKELSV